MNFFGSSWKINYNISTVVGHCKLQLNLATDDWQPSVSDTTWPNLGCRKRQQDFGFRKWKWFYQGLKKSMNKIWKPSSNSYNWMYPQNCFTYRIISSTVSFVSSKIETLWSSLVKIADNFVNISFVGPVLLFFVNLKFLKPRRHWRIIGIFAHFLTPLGWIYE